MAGMNDKKIHRYRMDGMAYALRIVEKDGVEGLRAEVKARGAKFIPLEATSDAIRDLNAMLGDRILNTFGAVMLFSLNEEFKFGKDRMNRFFDAFKKNCSMIMDLDPFGSHYEKISEYAEQLQKKYGIDLDLDKILLTEQENEKCRKKMLEYDYTLQFLQEHGFGEAAACLMKYAE